MALQPALLNEQMYLSLHVLERSAELELQESQQLVPLQYPQSRRTSITDLQLGATPAVSQGGAPAAGTPAGDKHQGASQLLRCVKHYYMHRQPCCDDLVDTSKAWCLCHLMSHA
jgi:hypothetical protein